MTSIRLTPATLGLVAALTVGAVALAAADDRARLERLNVRETVLAAEQGRNLNRLARLLTVLAQFRRDPPPALLVSPDDAVDAVRAAILVKAITPELQRRAHVYAVEAREIARQRRLAAVASEALFTADSTAAERRGETTPPGALTLRPSIEAPLTAPASLIMPTPGAFTQKFGAALPGGGRADGLTIAAAKGAQVAAPEAGVVQYVGSVKGWGVILILRLPGGYHLVLAGLDRATVGIGQSVAAGAPVGRMADGRQSSSDLYLEVRERGVPVDPGRWLKSAAAPATGD